MKKLILLIAFIALMLFNSAEAYDPNITYEKMIANSTVAPPFIIYSRLKDECYAQDVLDKWHCIKTGLAIAYAECSFKDYNTPFGLQSKDKSYKKWVSSFKKYWYKSKDAYFFYWDWGELGASHYCVSEESSWSDYGCPNGRKNMQSILNQLHIK